jgi:hypothetical protein
MTRSIAALSFCGVLALAGCGGSASPVAPTSPSGPLITDVFTGTIEVGGTATHVVTIKEANWLTSVTLTQAGPPSTIFMGLGIGAWTASTSTCTLLTGGSVQAGTTAQLSGYTQIGTYCVQVLDVGNIPVGQSITYSVTVTHY